MPCSQTPGTPLAAARPVTSDVVFSPSTIPQLHLNGAQSLQPFTAYGLPTLCLRLTNTVTGTRSRLDNRYGGSPLPVQNFHLLANKCLVAHQNLVQINNQASSSPNRLIIVSVRAHGRNFPGRFTRPKDQLPPQFLPAPVASIPPPRCSACPPQSPRRR